MIQDETGRPLPAITVLALVIRYLTDDMYPAVLEGFPGSQKADISWILTVPAIKQNLIAKFMKEAGKRVTRFLSVWYNRFEMANFQIIDHSFQ